jgi:hypothetical protein
VKCVCVCKHPSESEHRCCLLSLCEGEVEPTVFLQHPALQTYEGRFDVVLGGPKQCENAPLLCGSRRLGGVTSSLDDGCQTSLFLETTSLDVPHGAPSDFQWFSCRGTRHLTQRSRHRTPGAAKVMTLLGALVSSLTPARGDSEWFATAWGLPSTSTESHTASRATAVWVRQRGSTWMCYHSANLKERQKSLLLSSPCGNAPGDRKQCQAERNTANTLTQEQ